VLVTGGDDNGLLGSTETYDAPNATWTAAGSLGTARWGHTATLLANGQVLVVGGDSSGALASCERFDPVGGTWTAAGALATGRTGHTATRLGNGRVLAVGGEDGSGTAYASTELYDPTADTWTASGSLGTARRFHTTTLLGNGRVLAVAGENAGVLATNLLLFRVARTRLQFHLLPATAPVWLWAATVGLLVHLAARIHPCTSSGLLAAYLLAGGSLYVAGVAALAPRELRQVWDWVRGKA